MSERTQVGIIEIYRSSDGGYLLVWTSPRLMKGRFLRGRRQIDAVAETEDSLKKKVTAALERMIHLLPPKAKLGT